MAASASTGTPAETTRFAPSPTGLLHLGHAYAALFAWRRARDGGGRFLLRLEDIDIARCRQEFADAIIEDLAWLGIDWNGPVLRQSQRMTEYAGALARLKAIGLVYPCFCTRAEIAAEIARAGVAPHEGEPAYPGTCRTLDGATRRARMQSGSSYAWRLDAGAALTRTGMLTWHDEHAGTQPVRVSSDPVLARKDVATSYHLAVVVDDAYQQVSLVTRGVDLFAATHVQRLLQALLGLPLPRYHHHALLLGRDGKRLAKRDQAQTLRALREAGMSPGDVCARAFAGRLL